MEPLISQTIFEQHHIVMLIIDPRDGRIVHANRAAENYYGWSLAELIRKNIADINTLPAEAIRAEMDLAKSQQRNFFQFQHRLADGRIKEVESRSTPISWSGDTLLCSMVTDVTDRNRIEQDLRLTKEKLKQLVAERTEELSAANEELRALNEELLAQNEEIAVLNQNLQEMNQTLEQRVAERTVDLSAANQELIAQHEEIQAAHEDVQRSAQIQSVLREIGEASVLSGSLPELYHEVHRLLKKVSVANNAYISIIDEDSGLVIRPYSVDERSNIRRNRPIGKGLTEYVAKAKKTTHITSAELVRLKNAGEIELQLKHFDEWLGAPLFNPQGECFGVIAIYYTEDGYHFNAEDSKLLSIIAAQVSSAINRKRAEELIITSEGRLKRAQAMARTGNWEIDLKTKQVWASDEAYRIYGLVKEKAYLPLSTIQQVVCKEDRPHLDRALQLLLAGKEKYDVEFKICRADNGFEAMVHSRAVVQYDAIGNPDKVLGVIQDITERKRIEQAVVESEARYRAVLEQAPEAVTICDPDSGEIIEANSRFAERFGYDLGKDGPLTVFDLSVDPVETVNQFLTKAKEAVFLPLQRRILRHRNGSHVQVERSATLVRYRDRSLLVQTFRDVSDEVRREQEIRRDAELATRVQNALLKEAPPSKHLEITTIYEPHSYVGGDLYFMDWRYEGSLLRGFLIDAAGHGLSTALHTSAMHVLLREINEMDLPLPEQMRWLNRRAGQYFDDATFAGALGFELDLQTRQLRWSCAGMPLVWLANRDRQGIVSCPGMYLGICSTESFEMHSLPLSEGDSVCFMTDGLSEIVGRNPTPQVAEYSEMIQLLQQIALSKECRDDATAICIKIKSLPDVVNRREGWPRVLRFKGYGDYQRLKGEVGKILMEVTGQVHSLHEVAVHEALANAMECRDGVPRQHQARLRINKIGNCLIVRVRTSRIGFAGNAMLRRLRSHPDEFFDFGEDASMGRGIPIMLSTTDQMIYNSEGTEVLLAWRLDKQ